MESWWRFSSQVVSDSCDPMDCSQPGSSAQRILQARILEWVAISLFRRSSQPKNQTCDAEDQGSIPGLGRSPGEGNGIVGSH